MGGKLVHSIENCTLLAGDFTWVTDATWVLTQFRAD